jgi:hypothetical protein
MNRSFRAPNYGVQAEGENADDFGRIRRSSKEKS